MRRLRHRRRQQTCGEDGGAVGRASGRSPRRRAIEAYWAIYGGWRALLGSPFLWIAVVLTLVCVPLWTATDGGVRIWAQNAIEIVPGLLGFSLVGMAILLALSSPQLLKAIRSGGKPDSLFMRTVGSFLHFILLQTAAVCFALVAKAYSSDIISAIGFFALCYGTLVAVAVGWNLFQIARIFNSTAPLDDNDPAS